MSALDATKESLLISDYGVHSAASHQSSFLSNVGSFVAQHPILSAVVSVAVVGSATAAGVLLSPSSSSTSSPSDIPQQIMVSPAVDYIYNDASHMMHVTWVLRYGESFNGTPASSVSPAPPVFNNAQYPLNPRVNWGTSPDNLLYSYPAWINNYSYFPGKSNYTSPLLLNSTIGGCLAAVHVDSPVRAIVNSMGNFVSSLWSFVSSSPSSSSALHYPDCPGSILPGVTFYYNVGDDVNGFSQTYSSAPIPVAGTPNVRFAIMGDLGTTDNSADTLNHILTNHGDTSSGKPPFSAVLLVGDISYADGTQGVWDVLGNMISPVVSTIPLAINIGNHEWFDFASYSFTSYMARFRSPGGSTADASKLYYSFDMGLMHIVSVQGYCPSMKSTSTQPCLQAGSDQLNWLIADLQNVNRTATPFVIVHFHQPYVNSNLAHPIASEGLPMQNAIEQVLYDNKVDLVFSGHVHAYERSCRVFNYTCVSDGPYYITIGDAGNREGLALNWTTNIPTWSVFRQSTYGHGELIAVNNTHMVWQWHQNPDLAPTIADEVWIVKDETGPVGPGITGVPVFVNKEAERVNAQRMTEAAHGA